MKQLESNTELTSEAKKRFLEIHQRLQLRYLRLKHMQKHGILPKAPLHVPRCLNFTVPFDDLDEEQSQIMGMKLDENSNESSFTARINLPKCKNEEPYNILIDTANLELDGHELNVNIEEDLNLETELPTLDMEFNGQKEEELESWVELLLKVKIFTSS